MGCVSILVNTAAVLKACFLSVDMQPGLSTVAEQSANAISLKPN